MKYSYLKELLPSASYIYVDVTDEEIDYVTVGSIYVTTVENLQILGTQVPIEQLAHKLIEEPSNITIPGSTDFSVVEPAPTEVVPE